MNDGECSHVQVSDDVTGVPATWLAEAAQRVARSSRHCAPSPSGRSTQRVARHRRRRHAVDLCRAASCRATPPRRERREELLVDELRQRLTPVVTDRCGLRPWHRRPAPAGAAAVVAAPPLELLEQARRPVATVDLEAVAEDRVRRRSGGKCARAAGSPTASRYRSSADAIVVIEDEPFRADGRRASPSCPVRLAMNTTSSRSCAGRRRPRRGLRRSSQQRRSRRIELGPGTGRRRSAGDPASPAPMSGSRHAGRVRGHSARARRAACPAASAMPTEGPPYGQPLPSVRSTRRPSARALIAANRSRSRNACDRNGTVCSPFAASSSATG